MKKDYAQRGLPAPDEATVKEPCLGKGVDAPDLATVKDFLRFHAALGRGRGLIAEDITASSVNTFTEWFFAGFTRVTGTPIDKKKRSEVYKVS